MESQAWNTWESGLMPGDVMFSLKEQRVITSLNEEGWRKTFSVVLVDIYFFFKVLDLCINLSMIWFCSLIIWSVLYVDSYLYLICLYIYTRI